MKKKSRREEALLGILFAGRKKAGEIIAQSREKSLIYFVCSLIFHKRQDFKKKKKKKKKSQE